MTIKKSKAELEALVDDYRKRLRSQVKLSVGLRKRIRVLRDHMIAATMGTDQTSNEILDNALALDKQRQDNE